jgi:hypothetical protein
MAIRLPFVLSFRKAGASLRKEHLIRQNTPAEIPPFEGERGKGGIPLFGKEGLGEILGGHVWFIMDSLVNSFRTHQ